MNSRIPSRQLSRSGVALVSANQPLQTCTLCIRPKKLSLHANRASRSLQTLSRSSALSHRQSKPTTSSWTSTIRSASTSGPSADETAARALKAAAAAAAARAEITKEAGGLPQQGSLAPNSIFAPSQTPSKQTPSTSPPSKDDKSSPLKLRNPSSLSYVLNPRPVARTRWHTKMVVRSIRHRGRVSRAIKIMRTERQHLAKSHFFETSIKKLAPLARQIAGKNVDDAILQMRFSKKKAARQVLAHLMQAKTAAVVERGMGLGHLSPPDASDPSSAAVPVENATTSPAPPSLFAPKSPTSMYISQAWVNRGPYGREMEPRAMGRVNWLRPPSTGLSVLLKEERTREREKKEKEERVIRRRLGKSMWTQLPDRKVTRQSQYVLW